MNQNNPNPRPYKAMLVSVGGNPAPILKALHLNEPEQVWYFCSTGSREKADQIQAQLDWHPQARYIEVERFEELGPCYRELRRKIPEILSETRVSPDEVLVDYTGGTKTMSAALVLVAMEQFKNFSYVGGEQREKNGLGIVIDGEEKFIYQTNPWAELAVREVELAKALWNKCLFEAVESLLQKAAPLVPHREQFNALAQLAQAMACRHRLEFGKASGILSRLRGQIPLLFTGRPDHGLLNFVIAAQDLCAQCNPDTPNPALLREILDNALRTAAQHRYEDAAARLYRAMEMQGQIWLQEATQGAFINGRLKDRKRLPPQLADFEPCQKPDHEEIKLSLEQIFHALARLGHSQAQKVAADLQRGRNGSRWRAATEKRNASILAHGTQPIGKDGFELMKQIATEFLDFDLTHEANPIPPLEPAWFEAP